MSPDKLTLNVRPVNDQTGVIDIAGEVTGTAEERLLAAYSTAATPATRTIILNFSRLEYMNSSGIGLVVMILIRAQRQQQRVIAVGLSKHYRHIFELTRLDQLITLHSSEAEALATE